MHVLEDGVCVTCGPHELVDGVCETCSDAEPMGEDEHALLTALDELHGPVVARSFDPSKHARNPKGPGGGRFRSMVDRLKDAIDAHSKGGSDKHPFDGFTREQLRRVAKARGIELKRGEDRDSIAEKLLGHLGGLKPKAGKNRHERKTTSTGKLQPHVSGDALKDLEAKTRAAKKNLTPGQLKVVEQWTSGKGMVRKIQTGNVSEETAANFDGAMQALPKVDGLVYRAVSSQGSSSQFAANLKPGQQLDLGAPVSTSIDPRQSGSFGTNLYEIESPAASYLAGVGSKFGYEKEAVLAPGRYEVVSSEYAKMGLGAHTADVLVVRLRDVTDGDRSWRPTTGTDFQLVEEAASKVDAVHAAPYQRGKTPGEHGGFPSKDIDESLKGYAFGWYKGINHMLREDTDDPFGYREDVDRIDAAMGPISSDVQVWRGIRDPQTVFGAAWGDDVTGMRWRDDGYTSTTGNRQIAAGDIGGAGAGEVVMTITAPKGTPAIGMSDGEHSEQELLLGRGQEYQVTADHGVVDGIRLLDVEVIGG